MRQVEIGRMPSLRGCAPGDRRLISAKLQRTDPYWVKRNSKMPEKRLHWLNLLFIIIMHLGAVGGVLWLIYNFSWATLGLAIGWFVASGLGITMGYHRCFSHRAYTAARPLQAGLLFFGSAAVQNSALKWSADHRVHHAKVDTASDPYNIKEGFWWAHIGWVVHKTKTMEEERAKANVADLERNPLVRFQDKHYLAILALSCFLVPALIASFWGDAIGGLLVVGCLRLVFQWHATFSINSVAHMIGTRPYSLKNSARDSILTAFLTFGEGYHNFHHRFQSDYRNGIRWYHFDPSKWTIWSLSRIGLARDLKRASKSAIERARESVRKEKQSRKSAQSTKVAKSKAV